MQVDERTFAADIAGWVNEYLNDHPHLPSNVPLSRSMLRWTPIGWTGLGRQFAQDTPRTVKSTSTNLINPR